MKKNRKLALALAAVVSLGAFAQQAQNLQPGFYRVQNFKTQRYAYVCDNRGSINVATTSADMGSIALFLQKYRDRCADPASLCYIEKVSNKHNIHGQNTSLYDIVDHYVQIQDAKTSNGAAAYQITPLLAGHTIYLKDDKRSTLYDDEYSGSTAAGPWNDPFHDEAGINERDYYYWNFISFTPNGDEYLGIAPNPAMEVDGKYYKPYVIGFDMTLLSPDMKAYYVSGVKEDAVIIKEISGTIPYNTPVIIECSSTNPSNNRVDVSITKSARISGNRLTGNYFCYGNHSESDRKEYDPATMRVLMVKDGKLVFGTADPKDEIHTTQIPFSNGSSEPSYYEQCLNANESYLKVSSGSPAELSVMTESEYRLSHYTGDAAGIVSMILKKSTADMNADFNGDNAVTIADLVLYIEYLKNK